MHFRNFLMTNVTKDVGQRKFSYKSWRNNMGLSGESENAILHFKPWVHKRLKRPYVHQGGTCERGQNTDCSGEKK